MVLFEIIQNIRGADESIKNEYYSAELQPFQYRVVTMNMSGPTKKGYIDSRRLLVTKILSECDPDIVFCQEIPAKFKSEIIQKLDADDQRWSYELTENGREAGIMWNKTKFDCVTVQLRDRTCFVELKPKGSPQRSFIAVSYHGESNCTEPSKKEQFRVLTDYLLTLNSPFLIGGDFNFNTLLEVYLDWVTAAETKCFAGYKISSRMASRIKEQPGTILYKDSFYWDPTKSITMYLEWARPFVFVGGDDRDLSDEKLEAVEKHSALKANGIEVKKLLDHDPILGILKLRDQNQNQNLDQKFEKLKL